MSRTTLTTLTTLTTVSLTVLVWTAMLSFGGVAAETVMLYPNVFGDPPESLDRAREFLVAGGPADYFPPLGATVVLSSLAATVLAWREPRLRWWVVGAAAVFVACEFLFSVLFFWPRNEVMFVEGLAVHTAGVLRQTAREFEALHWLRLGSNAVAAAAAFMGFMALHRSRILGQAARSGTASVARRWSSEASPA